MIWLTFENMVFPFNFCSPERDIRILWRIRAWKSVRAIGVIRIRERSGSESGVAAPKAWRAVWLQDPRQLHGGHTLEWWTTSFWLRMLKQWRWIEGAEGRMGPWVDYLRIFLTFTLSLPGIHKWMVCAGGRSWLRTKDKGLPFLSLHMELRP